MAIHLTEKEKTFKRILEYFVGHMKYICSDKDGQFASNGPVPIQEPPIGSRSGQGAEGGQIQEYMETTANVSGQNFFSCMGENDQKICISIYPSGRGYKGGSYLHFVTENEEIKQRVSNNSASTNINPVFNNDVFDSIEVGPSQNDPTYVFPPLEFTFEELGLGIDMTCMSEEQKYRLQTFFKYSIEMRKQELMGSLTYRGVNQLLATHNMILYGSPGTGKTWSAKNIASWIICGRPYEVLTKKENLEKQEFKKKKQEFDDHCKVVQFHPSYDYTDFVEGLRPDPDLSSGGQIGFKRVDGVFKDFCATATGKVTKEFNQNTDNVPKNRVETYRLIETVNEGDTKLDNAPYVFIIDEINRGELSKIFGELFYSIDPGYRGQEGRVFTQYQNMVPKGDVFSTEKGGFYVPDNVYIIGTMNDIDRSVESMDFAMRRRFSFIEVRANERMDMWSGEQDKKWANLAKACMIDINQKIERLPGLSSAYHIGPAYFKKLNDYMKQQGDNYPDFFKLWDNHLYGVIFEYLRGKKDAEKTMIGIQEVYLKALVEAINRRFKYGGMWGKMLLGKWKNATKLDSSIAGNSQDELEKSIKDYLDRVSNSIKVISLVDLYKEEIETKKAEDKAELQIELSNQIHKLSIQIKNLMRIGCAIEALPAN